MRALQTRVQKLERGSDGDANAQPFYILWVPAGADRTAALAELRTSGEIPADIFAYCAEWKPIERLVRNGLPFSPMPRSRLTNQQRLSEDEVTVLFEAIGDDLQSSGFSSSANSSDDAYEQYGLCKMTNRELVGAILSSSECMRGLMGPLEADSSRL